MASTRGTTRLAQRSGSASRVWPCSSLPCRARSQGNGTLRQTLFTQACTYSRLHDPGACTAAGGRPAAVWA
ncbi:hypothetical protein HaLaN_18960 [Haematococcus lacustris]|uniref:Uncharacterized protein n=1 Tax=Haematococcus lacustris TaxID=44745 RepID=A0A699ZPP8_HAELA|nr:hypothetical protein HaLaN_18960 [Haematococcus lacustris]